jgi:hypothetical protein
MTYYYLGKVLDGYSDLKAEVLPGRKSLLASSLDSPLMSEKEK